MKHLIVLALLMPLAGHADDDSDPDTNRADYCNAVQMVAFTAQKMDNQAAIDRETGTRDLTIERQLAAQMLSYKASMLAVAKSPGVNVSEMCDGVSVEGYDLINRYAFKRKGKK